MGTIITTGIIVLFYFVLLLQEWFNKIISRFREDKNNVMAKWRNSWFKGEYERPNEKF